MTAHCDDETPLPPARRDDEFPQSGSRREAIKILEDAAKHLQIIRPDKEDTIQSALNYMIVHDGW